MEEPDGRPVRFSSIDVFENLARPSVNHAQMPLIDLLTFGEEQAGQSLNLKSMRYNCFDPRLTATTLN
jgi:hypothetical protein